MSPRPTVCLLIGVAVRILVSDQHPRIREAICLLLRTRDGWEICGEARNAHEAAEKALQLKPDVIVLDAGGPELDGLDATRALRETLPDAEVLILSLYDTPDIVEQAFQAGARGFLSKSASINEELLDAVAQVSRHELYRRLK